MSISIETGDAPISRGYGGAAWQWGVSFARTSLWKLLFAYVVLLAVSAFLGRWTPEFLQGRDLWHFTIARMVIPMVMLGVFAAVMRLVPATLMLAAGLLFVGMISAIKREATGEPFQVSDFFLAGQSPHLLSYVSWDKWLVAALIIPASIYAAANLRFRVWSLPLMTVCAALLSTYRLEPVVTWIHDNAYRIGIENLTFSQAESERMNGLATHLYFSTAGLRIHNYSPADVKAALAKLDAGTAPAAAAARPGAKPDIYIVLGEAWWRDPTDPHSPLDKMVAAGWTEGMAVSPVYGGTTPNSEFEVLTGVPVRSFQAGIIPYQHYLQYIKPQSRSLPNQLTAIGYLARAFHNFTARFWLRDKVYPLLGFASFDSIEQMHVEMQANGWPTDHGLYARVLERTAGDSSPHLNFIVTVQTHGPYAEDKAKDVIGGVFHPGITDYHDRLAGAVDELIEFDRALRKRGRPYVLAVFGDHLPGLRLHQWKSGMKQETDPRLHQVPLLLSSNSENVTALRDRMAGRPLYCLSPSLADWLGLGLTDRYFRHVAKTCSETQTPDILPAEAVIQNQLFSETPEL